MSLDLKHKKYWIGLILATFFVFLAVVSVTILAEGTVNEEPVLFPQSIDFTINKFASDITPPDWLFMLLWVAVYLYQVFWLLYALSLLCRKPRDGKGYLYYRPPFMPRALYVAFGLSTLLIVGWITLWTKELVELAFFAMLAAAALAVAALSIAAHALVIHGCSLLRLGNKKDVRLNRGLVQNGLGFYAAWLVFLLHQTLDVVLRTQWGVVEETAGTIVMGLYGGLIILYFILDLVVFTTALRFVFFPYVLFPITLAAILTNDWEIGDRNCLITLGLLAFSAFFFFFKLASIMYLNLKDPEPLLDECDHEESDLEDESDEDTEKYVQQAKLLLSQ